MAGNNREPNKSRRVSNAAERLAARTARSDREQLAVLDTRRGNSTRERERLLKRLEPGA